MDALPPLRPPNIDGIPSPLKQHHQWFRTDARKAPLNLGADSPAAWSNPGTRSAFADVVQEGPFVGFLLTDADPFLVIDLDGAIDEHGTVSEWAGQVIAHFGSYTEVSLSGRGVHIFILGMVPDRYCGVPGNIRPKLDAERHEAEVYQADRFMICTGDVLDGCIATIENRQDELDDFCDRFMTDGTMVEPKPPPRSAPVSLDDQRIIELASAARNGPLFDRLMAGDTSGHGADDSAADLALCNLLAFWTGRDPSQMDRMFRASGLMREKWNRPDYSSRTIQLAIASAHDSFGDRPPTPRRQPDQPDQRPPDEPPVVPPEIAILPVSGTDLVRDNPDLNPPVINGLLRIGETANLIAGPKMRKSFLTLQLALCVHSGRAFLGHETTPGNVLIVDNELHPQTLANRLRSVSDSLMIDTGNRDAMPDVKCLRGVGCDINGLARLFNAIEPGRYSLIILDALYRLIPAGLSENANADVTSLYNTIDRYAKQTGAAFWIVHHSSKGSQADKRTTDVGSGAGAISRAADSHLALREHDDDGCVVLSAVMRSWKPIEPMGLRWDFPVWSKDGTIDPGHLKDRRVTRSETRRAILETWSPDRVAEIARPGMTHGELCEAIRGAEEEEILDSWMKQLWTRARDSGAVHLVHDGRVSRIEIGPEL